MKKRIDLILFENNLYDSREKAKRAIMAGEVYLSTEQIKKASEVYDETCVKNIVVKSKDHAVSRGYYKLKKAAEEFDIKFENKVCIDIGSSTGGFTQLLLENGVKLVYAVDCGTNQLDYKIRSDKRVIVMEKTNARYLDIKKFDPIPVLAVMDVSFISVSKIIPVISNVLKINEFVTLIKPQFEAGKEFVGKGGIVRDKDVQLSVIRKVFDSAFQYGYYAHGITVSPIKGQKGNVEFLGWFNKTINKKFDLDNEINNLVF